LILSRCRWKNWLLVGGNLKTAKRKTAMSTVAEIEAAIERLSPKQVEELFNWLEIHRTRRASKVPVDAWLARSRGVARPGVTTAELLTLTRGDE